MQVDYGYSAHRRVLDNGIAGQDKNGNAHVFTGRVTILENKVNGRLRSVTVLSDNSPTAKAVARLSGSSPLFY